MYVPYILDVNNLQCQPLSYADFRWIDEIENFNVTTVAIVTYELRSRIDLEYPQHLHDAHTNLPFYPTREKSPKQEKKLLATLYDKKRYVIHYRNLQQRTHHGLKITKIYRVL